MDYTDSDFDAHVPEHIRDNYADVVAGQYDGDWNKLADNLDRSTEEANLMDVRPTQVLAAWARSQAAQVAPEGEDPSVKPPVRRGRPPKSRT